MRKKIEWMWEKLDETTHRAKVIGGWLVRHNTVECTNKRTCISDSMVFLPDRDHEWHIVASFDNSDPGKQRTVPASASDFEAK